MAERHSHLLTVDTTAALVVDVQENFRAHIAGFEEMVASTCLLLKALDRLGVPVAISEQYPQGLGRTVDEISQLAGAAPTFEKLEVSSCAAAGWSELPSEYLDRPAFVVVGIETHVCVSQTTHDLLAAGKNVHVVADAVGSRDPWQKELALRRLERAGAVVTSVEMALFELLGTAGTPEFRDVQRLIKEHDAAVVRRDAAAVAVRRDAAAGGNSAAGLAGVDDGSATPRMEAAR